MEEVPLRLSSDERDFEMDESDFLLKTPIGKGQRFIVLYAGLDSLPMLC